MDNHAGQRPALSTTAPAGSRDAGQEEIIDPAELRRRVSELVTRSADLGHRMRRNDARTVVLAFTETLDCSADGWNGWLAHRFDPTQSAAIANLTPRGGVHA